VNSNEYFAAQGIEAKSMGQTPRALRDLIFRSVDRAAERHYAEAYPMKCLQCSVAIQRLLLRAGIESQLWVGAVCAAEVFEDPTVVGWGGFWGQDHHVWLVTQFHELVDLSIGRLYRHPRRKRTDGVPMPPVWWTDIVTWPPVLKYLADSRTDVRLDPEETEDLELFLAHVDSTFDACLRQKDIGQSHFGSVLGGPRSMNELYESGDQWVVRALFFQEHSIAMPDWILEREEQLVRAHRNGTRAASRLAGTVESGGRDE
jgi:hypothetical protein